MYVPSLPPLRDPAYQSLPEATQVTVSLNTRPTHSRYSPAFTALQWVSICDDCNNQGVGIINVAELVDKHWQVVSDWLVRRISPEPPALPPNPGQISRTGTIWTFSLCPASHCGTGKILYPFLKGRYSQARARTARSSKMMRLICHL